MVKDPAGRIPPHDLDVEKAVLGALMLESDSFYQIADILTANSFYSPTNGKIFEVIKSLKNGLKPIDLLSVTSELKRLGQLDEIGGAYYVTGLVNNISGAAYIEHHAMIIQQLSINRQLIKIGLETAAESYQAEADIEDLINGLKMKISALEDSSLGISSGQSQSDVFQKMIVEVEADCREAAKGRQPGITTGFLKLNNATGGWRPSNLIILAARPGVGKTSLALHFAKAAAMSGKWVNFYSLEMSAPDLSRIMVSGECGVNRTSLRDGSLSDQDWNSLNAITPNFERLPLVWVDRGGLTVNMVKSNTIRNRKAGRCDLLIIDYLQLIKPTDKKVIREQQISEISRTLKEIALSENIPVICLSQLNRTAGEFEKPQMNQIRESGSVEQDADIILMPWKNQNQKFYLSVVKNRRGITGDIELYPNDEMTVFSDTPPLPFVDKF